MRACDSSESGGLGVARHGRRSDPLAERRRRMIGQTVGLVLLVIVAGVLCYLALQK